MTTDDALANDLKAHYGAAARRAARGAPVGETCAATPSDTCGSPGATGGPELARANQVRAGATNATFLEGRIEAVPLPDASIDVVVSNCVINLSADKVAVFAEAFRVLRPGGRLAVADVIADREPDAALRADPAAWAGCLAGAITRPRYRSLLADAGFVDIDIADDHAVADGQWSVFVRARTPPGRVVAQPAPR
jgi:SAM-dependent methyltransferase